MSRTPNRGEVWLAQISGVEEPKPWLIVSRNVRNRNAGSYLAVRITTTNKYAHLPTWVPVPAVDHACMRGYINTDTLMELFEDDFVRSEPECAMGGATLEAIKPALLKTLGYS